MAAKPIPDGYRTVTPYLIVQGVPKLLDFLKSAFNAQEIERMAAPDGTIRHAEVRIGDSMVMMGEAGGEFGPRPGVIHLYVPDVDATYQQALRAGASRLREVADQFYGDRTGGVTDPTGNQWWIATHKEDLTAEQIRQRMEAMQKAGAAH